MRIHPSLILAAAFVAAGGNSPRAQTVSSPVDALAQKLRDDPAAREDAGKRLEAFLLKPDSDGKSFVSAEADRAALGAVAREWGSKTDAGRVAVLLVVSTPDSGADARLRLLLAAWTAGAQIKKESAGSAATAFFADAADKAKKVLEDPRTRQDIDAAIQANDQAAVPVPGGPAAIKKAQDIRERGAGSAAIFGRDRAAQELDGSASAKTALEAAQSGRHGQAGRKTPEQMAALIADLNAAHREGRDGPKMPVVGSNVPAPSGVPSSLGPDAAPVEFQSLGSAEVAREPGLLDRAASAAKSDAPTIAEDLSQIRGSLKDAVPASVQGLTESNPNAVNEFFQWLRTAKESDMPAIDYTILPKGEVGHYELGLLSKGDIKVNHFIRNEPAHARATVVVHELYHYWDKKVARTSYPNVSYGYIDPASKHIHEYDAYLATSLYWEMVKKEGDASPLARMLDRIPSEPGQVREMVNGALGGGK